MNGNEHLASNATNLKAAVIGSGSALGGVGVSCLSELEQWLRVASLSVGLLIGLFTLAPHLRRWYHKHFPQSPK